MNQERITIVNELIYEIATRGRKFFSYDECNRISYFASGEKTLYYVDRFTQTKIPMKKGQTQLSETYESHFCEGDSLLALVFEFRDFILGEKHTNGTHGYSGLFSTHWGYDEKDMIFIREKAKEIGYL